MAAQVNMAHILTNHIKITTQIQNNPHSEPSEIKLNGSVTTTGLCGGGVREGTVPLALLSASCQSLPLIPTIKLGPSGADFWMGSLVCILGPCGCLQRTLVMLEVSPAVSIPTGFYSQRFWGFISSCCNCGLHGLSCSPVVPPGLSTHEWEKSHPPATTLPAGSVALPCILSTPAFHLHPSTSLVECLFFNSLVVGLP